MVPRGLMPALSSLVSDADETDIAKRAVRLILHHYGVPKLPKYLKLDFYQALSVNVARPDLYTNVVLSLNGGLESRLLALVSFRMETTRELPLYIHVIITLKVIMTCRYYHQLSTLTG